VLVVAARKAWPEYHKYGLYFCQPNRSFKPGVDLAFYKDGEIKTTVPKVTGSVESISLDEETVRAHPDLSQHQEEELLEAVELMRENGSNRYNENEKVLFLDPDLELDRAIRNDKTASDSNRTVAFVRGHRYVSLSTLHENPRATTELEE
jgi:hypothetical protein